MRRSWMRLLAILCPWLVHIPHYQPYPNPRRTFSPAQLLPIQVALYPSSHPLETEDIALESATQCPGVALTRSTEDNPTSSPTSVRGIEQRLSKKDMRWAAFPWSNYTLVACSKPWIRFLSIV
jgi:hypothetical protein